MGLGRLALDKAGDRVAIDRSSELWVERSGVCFLVFRVIAVDLLQSYDLLDSAPDT